MMNICFHNEKKMYFCTLKHVFNMTKKIILAAIVVVLVAAVAITVPTVMHYSKKHRIERLRNEALIHPIGHNPELTEFESHYPDSIGHFADTIMPEEISGMIPHFLQWDPRWGYAPYGDNVIGLSGCAPTCVSMVMIWLTGDPTYTPKYVADYATNNDYYIEGNGTKWSFFTEGVAGLGITGYDLKLKKRAVYKSLKHGNPIICSMYPGDFTTSGHFIVLSGIENDSIRLLDPNSRQRSTRLYSFKELEWQIHHLWAFSKTNNTQE